MAASTRQRKIDEVIAKAREALMREAWFEAERLGLKALGMARQDEEFQLMATIVPILLESRQQRLQRALQTGKVIVITEPISENMKVKKGCYLVQPPQVGSDARRLRLAALNADVPVTVVCREPLTRTKLVPVVAISPGCTLRVKVEPPAKPAAPNLAWLTSALEALGDQAIESIDPTLPATRRVDALIDALDAHPDHVNLHLALEVACKQAAEEAKRQSAGPAAKTKIKS